MGRHPKKPDMAQVYRQVGPYLSIGVEFAASILLCLFVGRWLDGRLGTYPVLMLIGALLGAAAGFYSFIRTVLRLQEKEKQKAGRGSDRHGDSE